MLSRAPDNRYIINFVETAMLWSVVKHAFLKHKTSAFFIQVVEKLMFCLSYVEGVIVLQVWHFTCLNGFIDFLFSSLKKCEFFA